MAATPATNSDAAETLYTRLAQHADGDPARAAIVSAEQTLSYGDLARLVALQAQRLTEAGLGADAVIGIRCGDDVSHLVLCLAASQIGATSVTIPDHETQAVQEALADRCGVTIVIDAAAAVRSTPSAKASLPGLAGTLLFATSGTTGNPKIVVLRDADLVAQAHRHIGSREERFACLASMEHNFAKRHRLYCVAEGATNLFLDNDPDTLVDQCQSLGLNVLHLSGYQAQELLAVPSVDGLAHIRLKLGGAYVPVPLRQALRSSVTKNLQAGYGTTETGAIAFTDPDDANASDSVGRPLPGLAVRAVAPDRSPLPAGEHGELAIRGEGLFREYLGNPELTAAKRVDGWFYTGDTGYLDDDGRIYVRGRADDMFVFNSMNIFPQDIESKICAFPGIADAAVLPKTSDVHGNIPIALVVFDKGAKPKLPALEKFVKEQTGLRCPRQFLVVNDIPRNAAGKIARGQARQLSEAIDNHRKAVIQALDPGTRERLDTELIAAFERGDTDIRLRDINMDSLARMELLIALEVHHDLIITPQEFNERGSLGKIAARLQSAGARSSQTPVATVSHEPAAQDAQPTYVVRLFRRTFSYCDTVAQFNRALITLEHRLTPNELRELSDAHRRGQLIPAAAAEKFHTVFDLWLTRFEAMMNAVGKREPEPFHSKRIAPTVTLFHGPGAAADKTLIICFAAVGVRHLMMPNAVLMQHTPAKHYDLLMIAEPLNQGYEAGVPGLGDNVQEVVDWVAKQDLIGGYGALRTVGSSAGAYAALIAGHTLGAELTLCVGGRFHSERHPGKIIGRILTARKAARNGKPTRALFCYGKDKTRDRHYAQVMRWISGGNLLAIEFTNGSVGHLILERLLERDELAPFFARTLFASIENELTAVDSALATLRLPEDQLQSS